MVEFSPPPVSYELILSEAEDLIWSVTRVALSEAIDAPYRAEIEAQIDAEVESEALLGCDAVLVLTRGEASPRRVCGLVGRVDLLGQTDGLLELRFVVVPAFALLDQGLASRMWQGRSVQDIVLELLGAGLAEYGREVDASRIQRGSEPREYCTQYRESDLAFVARLLREQGISYAFEHEGEVETLVLYEDNDSTPALVGADGSAEVPMVAELGDLVAIQSFEWRRGLTSSAILIRDHDWREPTSLLSATAGGSDGRGRTRRRFVHGQRRFETDDLELRANDRLEADARFGQVAHGRGSVADFRPGLRFALSGHASGDLEREYLITKVVHSGSHRQNQAPGQSQSAYVNEFECVPTSVPLRPRADPARPLVHGPQTAMVCGPEDEEIHTDEHGRVRVQLYWQEQAEYASDASCWIRCAQSWAGPGWGAQFIPRVGMEVVVEFLEGNPDRPLVTGCVYNPRMTPSFELPEHKTRSGWRTRSSPDSDGFNELSFQDAAGDEQIYLRGEKDWVIELGNDERSTIGSSRHAVIANDDSVEVGNDQTVTVACTQMTTVLMNRVETVGLTSTETVGGAKTESVGGMRTVIVGGISTQNIAGLHAVNVGATASMSVAGSNSVTVGEDASETVVGAKSVNADSVDTTARKALTYKAGEKVVIEAKDEMIFKCGKASIVLKNSGEMVLKGKELKLTGTADVIIKGKNVLNN